MQSIDGCLPVKAVPSHGLLRNEPWYDKSQITMNTMIFIIFYAYEVITFLVSSLIKQTMLLMLTSGHGSHGAHPKLW